jgi:hypothetical protein
VARVAGAALSRGEEDDDSYRKTPFLSILLYVLLLMGAMALLAAVAVWLLRR